MGNCVRVGNPNMLIHIVRKYLMFFLVLICFDLHLDTITYWLTYRLK